MIEREFAIDPNKSIDKGAELDPTQFGYRSHHFVATLNDVRAQLPEYQRFANCRFEVQIRSILRHAWAEVEHDLGYKTPVSVPPQIRKRFSRLAGSLEMADEELISLRVAIAEHISAVHDAVVRGDASLELDRESLLAYVANSEILREIDHRILEGTGSAPERISDIYAEVRVSELQEIGIETLGDLDQRLTESGNEVVAFAVDRLTRRERSRGGFQKTDEGIMSVPPDDDDDEHGTEDFDPVAGQWLRLSRGIGLFYLYLVAVAEGRLADYARDINAGKRPRTSRGLRADFVERMERRAAGEDA